jgi:hypothetical protein
VGDLESLLRKRVAPIPGQFNLGPIHGNYSEK